MLTLYSTIMISLRFLLEIITLLAISLLGYKLTNNNVISLILMVGFPIVSASIWAIFGSPNAPIPIEQIYRYLLIIVLFSLAAFSIHNYFNQKLAYLFMIIAFINTLSIYFIEKK